MIAIIDYKMGNVRSVQKAFEYIGVKAVITADKAVISTADAVVLPGVGAYRDAVHTLKDMGLDTLIKELASSGKPTLGICLGHQLLFGRSYEGGSYEGLGLIEGEVVRFDDAKGKIPHMGWNNIECKPSALTGGISNGDMVYFVHSYYADCPDEVVIAYSEYCGVRFAAAVKKGNVTGMQFHPEKSGDNGLKILRNFAKAVGA